MPMMRLVDKPFNTRTPLPSLTCRAHNQANYRANFRFKGVSMEKQRLQRIEQYILGFFQRRQQGRILAKELFDSTAEFANADLVRALEDLEKGRLMVRYTDEGNDYISLTAQGAIEIGLDPTDVETDNSAMPHPPRSAIG